MSYLEMSGSSSKSGGSVSVSSQVAFDQHEIWDQVLVEGWRYLRDYFYDKDMHGIDWDEVLSRYRPRMEFVGTATEFNALYREMLGEINSSHMGFSSPSNEREAPAESTGDLGVYFDASYEGAGWKVEHAIKDGPATKPGSELYPGDVILEVNDESIDANTNRALLLRNKVGKPIQLTVESLEPDEDGETVRTVAIKPTSSGGLRTLKYNEWVEDNRDMVDELSGGKLYYQHIKGMNHVSLVQFRDELFSEAVKRDGLVL
ncbi:MAG: PDZ domain-containing protein, partial [Planctomycetales bacterium]